MSEDSSSSSKLGPHEPMGPAEPAEPVENADVQRFFAKMVEHLEWDLKVSVESEDDASVRVELDGADRDVVVQNRAEVLEAIQYLANRAFGQDGGRRVVVDCDGYRERKEMELKEIAMRVAERVRLTGREEELGLMNPYERRIVHLAVAELEGVTTASAGDGVMKRVVILPE